ncbi:hypothetical protein HDC92_004354 [Pedobacter sp. AK017]|uniref:TraM recognition domain-containing protein n=1 Tax=Pedobacter sp. AK017 TaxID=2723073 RepID=UPI00160868C7|nr:TraM recognition domain-containing protein [Pedobacter sp. AK017]MBB5440651.1 hypothetical protein [Pedobacter sp. AK017]
MDETREQQSMLRFFQFCIYLSVIVEVFLFIFGVKPASTSQPDIPWLLTFTQRISRIPFYDQLIYSKLFTLLLICLASIGTLSRKQKDLNPKTQIAWPMAIGAALFFSSIVFQGRNAAVVLSGMSLADLAYLMMSFAGAVLLHVAMDNVSKIISSKLGKDKWNTEGESFMQRTTPKEGRFTINIPMQFYYRKKVHDGYLVIENSLRGTICCGVPGAGKSFGFFMPVLRQLISQKGFTLCCFDFKFPDLGKIAYYHYLLAKQQGKNKDFKFHVINLNDVAGSRRINPMKKEYLRTLADASETAEALVEAMKKGDKSGGSDQFFTQSAINFLAACIYFFSQFENGRYSTLPHTLAFLNCSYEEIFSTLFSNKELDSLLSPFRTAYKLRAFDQLEGQIGTLKIFLSRLATKETFWVFSGDDFLLKISDPKNPSILVLAGDPATQSINSACYSVVVNRITRLVNSRGNLPVALVLDESPVLYAHNIHHLISQARSNLVAVFLGLQELPMLKQQYGKDNAAIITSVVGNVLSGAVRSKETLEWLEKLSGKVKQQNESLSIDRNKTSLSLSEKLEPLIPAGKIASLKTGEMVGILANEAEQSYTGKFDTSAVHCRINLDLKAIKKEEAAYRDLPVYYDFGGRQEQVLFSNYNKISDEVQQIVKRFKPAPPTNAPEPKAKEGISEVKRRK